MKETAPKAKRPGRKRQQAGDRPKDVIGFLLALPLDPTAAEVGDLAREFGINGRVEVTTYTSPTDGIQLDVLDDRRCLVTRRPRDMEGFIRIAERLMERIGRDLMSRGGTGTVGQRNRPKVV